MRKFKMGMCLSRAKVMVLFFGLVLFLAGCTTTINNTIQPTSVTPGENITITLAMTIVNATGETTPHPGYGAVLLPNGWSVNSSSVMVGAAYFQMFSTPLAVPYSAPEGYFWYTAQTVGSFTVQTTALATGTIEIITGSTPGTYNLEYWVGDTWSGWTSSSTGSMTLAPAVIPTCYWNAGEDNNFSNINNWQDEVGGACSSLSGANLIFDSKGGSNEANNSSDLNINSLTITSDYSGTITFSSGNVTTTGNFSQSGGTVNFASGNIVTYGNFEIGSLSATFNGADGTGHLYLNGGTPAMHRYFGAMGTNSFYQVTNNGYYELSENVTVVNSFINNGAFLPTEYNLFVPGNYVNNSIVSLTGMGNILKEATGGFTETYYDETLDPAGVTTTIVDKAANLLATVPETISATITVKNALGTITDDTEVITLTETTASSGIFIGYIPYSNWLMPAEGQLDIARSTGNFHLEYANYFGALTGSGIVASYGIGDQVFYSLSGDVTDYINNVWVDRSLDIYVKNSGTGAVVASASSTVKGTYSITDIPEGIYNIYVVDPNNNYNTTSTLGFVLSTTTTGHDFYLSAYPYAFEGVAFGMSSNTLALFFRPSDTINPQNATYTIKGAFGEETATSATDISSSFKSPTGTMWIVGFTNDVTTPDIRADILVNGFWPVTNAIVRPSAQAYAFLSGDGGGNREDFYVRRASVSGSTAGYHVPENLTESKVWFRNGYFSTTTPVSEIFPNSSIGIAGFALGEHIVSISIPEWCQDYVGGEGCALITTDASMYNRQFYFGSGIVGIDISTGATTTLTDTGPAFPVDTTVDYEDDDSEKKIAVVDVGSWSDPVTGGEGDEVRVIFSTRVNWDDLENKNNFSFTVGGNPISSWDYRIDENKTGESMTTLLFKDYFDFNTSTFTVDVGEINDWLGMPFDPALVTVTSVPYNSSTMVLDYGWGGGGLAPSDQDTVFPTTSTVDHGANVTLATSTAPDNFIWFAPYNLPPAVAAQTSSFVESATMTKAVGTSTSILAPEIPGGYKLFVINNESGVSDPSSASLVVKPYNQNQVFPVSMSKNSDGSVIIGPNLQAVEGYNYFSVFAPPGEGMTYIFTHAPDVGHGEYATNTVSIGLISPTASTSMEVPLDLGDYSLSIFMYVGSNPGASPYQILSNTSTAILTVTPPVDCYWNASAGDGDMSNSTNWQTSIGGACTITTSTELHFTDSVTSTNAINSSDLQVAKIILESDYTGIVTLSSGNVTSTDGLVAYGGTVDLTGGNLYLGGELTLSGGSLNSSLGTDVVMYGSSASGYTGGKSSASISKLTLDDRAVVFDGYIDINDNLVIDGPSASFSCYSGDYENYPRFYGEQIDILNGGIFDPEYCYFTYKSTSTSYITPGNYYTLDIATDDTSLGAYLTGNVTVNRALGLQSNTAVLNAGGYTVTLNSDASDTTEPFAVTTGAVFNADTSTLIFNLSGSGEVVYLPQTTYHNITLNNISGSVIYRINTSVGTDATSTGSFINNGIFEVAKSLNLMILGDYQNNGTTTIYSGSIKKEASGGFTASSYDATGPTGSATITITAKERNFSALEVEKIDVTVTTTNGDSEKINLNETTASSGQFSATISFAASSSLSTDNGTLDIIGATGTLYLSYSNDYGPLTDKEGNIISAEFVVITVPDDQNDLFTTSSTVEWNSTIPLTTSTAPNNFIWFAPYSLSYTTSSFVESATMTMAVGTSTTIEAPDTPDAYRLYVINNDTGVSDPSNAILFVRPNNENDVFGSSANALAGNTTSIAGNTLSGSYVAIFATSGATMESILTNAPSGGNGSSSTVSMVYPFVATTTQIYVPWTAGDYNLYTAYYKGSGEMGDEKNWVISFASTNTLTVNAPTNQDTVFPVSTTIERTGEKLYVTINPSGFVSSQLWFVTSTELTSAGQFIEGDYMVKTDDLFGTSTQANAPGSVENYYLYIIDQYSNVSGPSDAILTIVSSSNKNVKQFWVDGLPEGTVYGTITESATPTIDMRVSTSTDVTSLTPSISLESSLATVDPASGISQNFTNPVNYTVTAENGTHKVYIVSIIPYADMAELEAEIVTATAMYNVAVTGTFPGEYPTSSMETFATAIQIAQGYTSTSLQSEVDQAVLNLQQAEVDFEDAKIPPDTTPPVITKVNGDMKIYEGTVYTDPGASAYDAVYGTTTVDVYNPVDTNVTGTYYVVYTATDTSSNTASTTRKVEVLTLTTTAQNLTTSTQASTTTPTIVIGDNSTATSTVTVPDSITSTIYLDISATSATSTTSTVGTIPGTVTVNASTSIGIVQVAFPAGMTVTAPTTTWDGTIALPTIEDNSSVTVIADSGYTTATVNAVVALGFGDTALTFDKAVRILMPGKSGNYVGYYRGTTFTKITSTCSADTQTAGNALSAGGDCKINVGSDLVVWTKHFTDYVAYTQTYTGGGGGGGGGGGSVAPTAVIPTAGLNPILINAGAKTTVSRFVNLGFNVSNATQMAISENSAFLNAIWEPYLSNKPYTLSAGNGFKTIYSKFKSSSGGMTSAFLAGITLIESSTTTAPTSSISVSAECSALSAGDMIKVVGKPAIYVLDNNLNYRYFSDGDVYKSWNNHEKYVYKAITQTCFNSLSQPSSAPYHVFYRPGSHVVRYLSSDKLYVVGLNNTLYPITVSAAKAIFGTNYVVKVIGLSEWPYYAKSTETISSATVYPGMLAKIDGTTYFVDESKTLREVDSAGMVANQFKTAYVRPLPSGSGTGLPTGEKIMSLIVAFSTPLGL